MLRISSSQLDTSMLHSTSNSLFKATSNRSVEEAGSAGTASENKNVSLSGRALSVQKLNQEFFSNGTRGFQITSDFVAKLEEYGLINSTEASRLSPLISPLSRFKSQDDKGDHSSLDKVTQFINDFRDELKEENPESSLINILNKAETIIDDFDGSLSDTTKADIKSVLAELNSFTKSDAAEGLSEDNKESLNQLGLTLRIADRLNPSTVTSGRVNSYLSVMNRFA